LPGFVLRAADIRAKGVDRIVCVSVNDPFVMGAWAQDQGVGDAVVLLADGNGELTEAMGLTLDGSGFGLGSRSQRYAAILEDGIVSWLAIEPGPGLAVSSAEEVLAAL
jgi:peroxiredoxin